MKMFGNDRTAFVALHRMSKGTYLPFPWHPLGIYQRTYSEILAGLRRLAPSDCAAAMNRRALDQGSLDSRARQGLWWLNVWSQFDLLDSAIPLIQATGVKDFSSVAPHDFLAELRPLVSAEAPPEYVTALTARGSSDYRGVLKAWRAGIPPEYHAASVA